MIKTNYAKITGEYPEYLHLPVELKSPLIINGVTHPIGGAAPTIEASKHMNLMCLMVSGQYRRL